MWKIVLAAAIIVVIIIAGISLIAFQDYNSHTQLPTTIINGTSSNAINPGLEPSFSCPLETKLPVPTKVVNVTGLSVYSTLGITDYVLSPGGRGDITYTSGNSSGVQSTGMVTSAVRNLSSIQQPSIQPVTYYQTEVKANYTVTPLIPSRPNVTKEYKVCYTLQNSTTCRDEPTQPNTTGVLVPVVSQAHSGVTLAAMPLNQTSGNSIEGLSILNISSSSSAPQGTYWLSIGGGPCNGSPLILLTIGTKPYKLNSSQISPIYS